MLTATLAAAACRDPGTALGAPSTPSARDAIPAAAAGVPLRITSALNGGMCVDAAGQSREPGTPMTLWNCWEGANQQFTYTAEGQLTAYDGELCLDAAAGRGEDGDLVILWRCHGGTNQRWTVDADGTIRGINGKCLDAFAQGATPGTRLVIWNCWGGANQRWAVQPISGAPPAPTPPAPPAPPGPPGPPPAPPGPPPGTPGAGPWTRCAAGGDICGNLVAVRPVRLVAPGGAYVEKDFYGQALCDPVEFDGRNPAPGTPLQSLHCEAGALRTATLTNPSPGMGGLAATVVVPVGDAGAAGAVIRPTAGRPVDNGTDGAFRIQCRLAKFAFDDPIVYPNQPGAAHLHVFFGNTDITAHSTVQSLANTGNSTCSGGTVNRTGYWVPAMIDARTGEVQAPLEATIYYKTGYGFDPRNTRPLPTGLRMIAGDKNNTGVQEYVDWSCGSRSGASIPADCPAGEVLRLSITFPQCWDGVNLDSPDHQSHMAYPERHYSGPDNPFGSRCPASHPVQLPVIAELFDYRVPAAGATAHWRLSSDMYGTSRPGGLSAHADWMMAWDDKIMSDFISGCLVAARDCGVGLLGNSGRQLQFQ